MNRTVPYVLIATFLVVLGMPSQNATAQERSGDLFLTLKKTLLLIKLKVPDSAAPLIDNQGETPNAKAIRLAGILRYTQRLFQPPPEAGCIRRQAKAALAESSTVVASWVFECAHPEQVDLLETSLFDLLQLDSIHAVTLPGGQQLMTRERPSLRLKED
tara:strand:- start:118 stop:594 length:477 start_codon:yes stop_codon:yes gene_type:complete